MHLQILWHLLGQHLQCMQYYGHNSVIVFYCWNLFISSSWSVARVPYLEVPLAIGYHHSNAYTSLKLLSRLIFLVTFTRFFPVVHDGLACPLVLVM